jgi:glycosyltransferase involved in cell wall biosynthesis
LDDIGKISLKKVGLMVVVFFKLIGNLVQFKPHLVYFTIAPTGIAFYRDFLLAMVVKMFGSGLVFHLHGRGFNSNARKSKLYNYLCKKLFKNCYCIHLSEILSKDVPFPGIKKRYIVPCGIPEVNGISLQKDQGDITHLLYLSNYIRTKGVLDLIDAIADVINVTDKIQLKLIGKPFDLSIEFLENYIHQKGLSSFITVCGPKYDEAKYEELELAGIFILPTYYPNEAFPVALLEAFEFGIPCISTIHAGIPDIIEDDITGYVVMPQDKKELADKIILLLSNPDLRNEMGRNARKKFVEKYTLTHFETNLSTVFSDILYGEITDRRLPVKTTNNIKQQRRIIPKK